MKGKKRGFGHRSDQSLGDRVPPYFMAGALLERSYVFSLRAFFALSYDELNLLTFFQRLETCAGDGAVVDKDVGAALLLDKAEAFAVVEPLNSSSCFICHIH